MRAVVVTAVILAVSGTFGVLVGVLLRRLETALKTGNKADTGDVVYEACGNCKYEHHDADEKPCIDCTEENDMWEPDVNA